MIAAHALSLKLPLITNNTREFSRVPGLIIQDSVCREESRREFAKMGRTMADVLIERGRIEGQTETAIETRQQTLIRLLRRRFGKLPAKVTRAINATTATEQLDEWLDRFATAQTLEELRIGAQG